MPIDSTQFEQGESHYSIQQEILNFLRASPDVAYNVREITTAVMDLGVAERNVERPSDLQTFMAQFVDVATVATILDRLVDNGHVERRIVDVGTGRRSYYRTRAG